MDNLGKYEEAITCYDKALKINPDYADAWSNRGVALGNLGKYEEAITCYDKALKINPDYAQAYGNLGIAFLDSHQYKDAIDNLTLAKNLFLEKNLQDDSNKAAGYQLWAKALQNWSKEEYGKSVSHFKEAISLFRNLHLDATADSLELISRIVPLDRQFMKVLRPKNLIELQKESSKICEKISKIAEYTQEYISADAEKILLAKATCFTALCDAAGFRKPDPRVLDEARNIFRELQFETSIIAVNSLEKFIRGINKYEKYEDISKDTEYLLLELLKSLDVLDGVLTKKIPIKREYYTAKPTAREGEPEILLQPIGDTEKEWVRVCLIQLDFTLEYMRAPGEFGYILKEKEETKKKVFEALKIARTHEADIVCFPELSTLKEWVATAKAYQNTTIVFGSYYDHGFNTCPIIVNGQDYYIQKINPSPQFETEVIKGMKMKKGKRIFVFQTKCGVFAVLICIDYLKEAHHILHNSDEKIKNVDFLIVPEYNGSKDRFQKKGDVDCQEGSYPYIVQVNCWKIQGKEVGGTCVIGTEHKDAVERYKRMGLRTDDAVEYKLIEPEGESIVVVDLDIKRKGIIIPASGPKMNVVQKYVHENGKWRAHFKSV